MGINTHVYTVYGVKLPWNDAFHEAYEEIEEALLDEFGYAEDNPDDIFLLTPIGTGLAGYDKTEIFKLIRNCAPLPSNIVFTKEWFNL